MHLVENGALRLPPHPRPSDVLDRHKVAVLGLLQELLDQRLVWHERRVLVSVVGVVVHEGCVVLDSVVAREVAEIERPALPEQSYAPDGQEVGEYAGKTVTLFEAASYYGGIELLPVMGSK